jgi:hypothetical protein
MKRLRFFDGQLLTAQDFQAEQEYQLEKRRLHNRLLHGVGVINGLGVSVDDVSVDDRPVTSVLVSPGLALDSHGNEILVESPVRIDLTINMADSCFVMIEFTESPTDAVPGANGGLNFSRVTEGYQVRIVSDDPSQSTNTAQLCLARLIRVSGHWVVDETYCRQTL